MRGQARHLGGGRGMPHCAGTGTGTGAGGSTAPVPEPVPWQHAVILPAVPVFVTARQIGEDAMLLPPITNRRVPLLHRLWDVAWVAWIQLGPDPAVVVRLAVAAKAGVGFLNASTWIRRGGGS